MAQLARSKWGLDTGILRSARGALLTSLILYGLVVICSYTYEGLLRRMDTMCANVAARRIVGVSRTARLEVLHPVAGAQSSKNLHVQQRAKLLGRTLRARNSTVRDRTEQYLNTQFSMRGWEKAWREIPLQGQLVARAGMRGV